MQKTEHPLLEIGNGFNLGKGQYKIHANLNESRGTIRSCLKICFALFKLKLDGNYKKAKI